MAGKNPLGKFRSKPAPSSMLAFRFNPAEEDLIEEYSSDANSTYSLQNMASFTSNNSISDALPSSQTPSLVDSYLDNYMDECSNVSSKDEDNTSRSDEPASPSHSTANSSKLSSRDASPSKESIKDFFTKTGKRSSSLDYGFSSDPDRWSLSGIKGKIVRRFEELSKDAQDHWLERHKKLTESTSNGLPSTKEEGSKSFSLRSQSSCDVRSQVEEVTRSPSVEEGIDCTADDIRVPYSYHVSKDEKEQDIVATTITTTTTTTAAAAVGESSQSTRKSAISAVATGAQVLLRKRTRQHSGPSDYTFSLSSLKATKSFESDIFDNEESNENWEFVEKQSSVEEEPEEVILCDSASIDATISRGDSPFSSHASITPTEPEPPDNESVLPGLLSEVRTMWRQPKWRTRFVYLGVTFVALQVVPIGTYLSGFLTGCLLSTVLACSIWWLFKAPAPKEPLLIPQYSTLPPLKIPPEDQIPKSSIHKGWMNELPAEYNPDTYHVNSTLSVYIRLDGEMLRLSRPKTNLPRRAMWNEPKQTPVFIKQRHYCISNASVMLVPEGLARKRLWSKKYPICISIPDNQSSNLKFKDETSDTNSADDSPGSKIILYLFARTCREKEEWFRRFLDAASTNGFGGGSERNSFAEGLASTVPRYSFDLPSPILEDCVEFGSLATTRHPSIEYKQYMSTYMNADDKESITWLNAFIGRIFYDFLTEKTWSQLMAVRIQKKLSVIKVPYFMEQLKLRDINLGCCMPQVQRSCEPVMDDRGLWMDFDLTYKGTFQMTLETKLNLMKLRKEQKSSSDKNVQMLPPVANRDDESDERNRSYLYNSDEEDSAESSSDEDTSQTDTVESTAESSSQPSSPVATRSGGSSTGKMVLHWVDKIAQSRYFQQATENRYIRKAMTGVSNTPLVLTVEVHGLVGTLALNVPPPPTDRLWYGFRGNPQLSITARPKLGEHVVTLTHITDWIEKKLALEFQKLLVMPNMDDFPIPIMDPGYLPQRRDS